MKGNCNYQPNGIIEYGKSGTGQVLFNIQRNDKEVDGVMQESWDFDYCEVHNFKRDTIITSIIRTLYSQDAVEAILSNFNKGKDVLKFMRFQNFRDFAKAVADGRHFKSEVSEFYERKIYEILMPFSSTLQGGRWAELADYALKVKNYTSVNVNLDKAYVYVSWILPEHLEALQADMDVVITEMAGL